MHIEHNIQCLLKPEIWPWTYTIHTKSKKKLLTWFEAARFTIKIKLLTFTYMIYTQPENMMDRIYIVYTESQYIGFKLQICHWNSKNGLELTGFTLIPEIIASTYRIHTESRNIALGTNNKFHRPSRSTSHHLSKGCYGSRVPNFLKKNNKNNIKDMKCIKQT